MSYLRPSSDVALVSPVTACLVAVYGAERGRGAWAEIEPLLMMRPPRGSWSFMSRNASCVHRNMPVRFTSTTAFHCSKVTSSSGTAGAPRPALLKRMSSRPKVSLVKTPITARALEKDNATVEEYFLFKVCDAVEPFTRDRVK